MFRWSPLPVGFLNTSAFQKFGRLKCLKYAVVLLSTAAKVHWGSSRAVITERPHSVLMRDHLFWVLHMAQDMRQEQVSSKLKSDIVQMSGSSAIQKVKWSFKRETVDFSALFRLWFSTITLGILLTCLRANFNFLVYFYVFYLGQQWGYKYRLFWINLTQIF